MLRVRMFWGYLFTSKQPAWNLYTVLHEVLENSKQANSISFSTYFMISATDTNLLTYAECKHALINYL